MPNPPLDKDVLLVGVDGAGKTALANRLFNDTYSDYNRATIGAQAFNVSGPDEKPVRVWDIAGHERFKTTAELYYRKAHVVMLVIDKSRSLDEQQTQLDFLKEQQQRIQQLVVKPTFVLVITKSDLTNPDVIPDERLREELGLTAVVHCSAKMNSGITEVRDLLKGNLAKKQIEQQREVTASPLISEEKFSDKIEQACGECLSELQAKDVRASLLKHIVALKECFAGDLTQKQKLQSFQKKYHQLKFAISEDLALDSGGKVAVRAFLNEIAVIQLQEHSKKFLKQVIKSQEKLSSAPVQDKNSIADAKLLAKKATIVKEMLQMLIAPASVEQKLLDYKVAFEDNAPTLTKKTIKDNITFGFLVGLSVITAGLGALAIAIHTYVKSDKKRFGFWEPKEDSISKEIGEEIVTAPKRQKR